MMNRYSTLTLLLFLLSCTYVQAQEVTERLMPPEHEEPRNDSGLRVAFYNVENLFDLVNDSIKRDDDFTPTGIKGWNKWRYRDKLRNIYRVVMAVGGWEPPAIVGLCEVENRLVMDELVTLTPLRRFHYQVVHFESPDKRGIDNALIYRPDKFEVLHSEPIEVVFPFDLDSKTRDILYVMGRTNSGDSLHVFVNHWPSRFGGHMETDRKRNHVGHTVRKKVDQIMEEQPLANIIIMGDLNDLPTDASVLDHLQARASEAELEDDGLFNLMYKLQQDGYGTHQHVDLWHSWSVLDQIVVSAPLLRGQSGLHAPQENCVIYKEHFLIEGDTELDNDKPFRTYIGPSFHGGFSDHLPIYVDVDFVKTP